MTARYPWARTVSVLIGIAVVLGMLVVVSASLADRKRTGGRDIPSSEIVYGPGPLNGSAVDEEFRRHNRFLDPVPLGTAVTLAGEPGFSARLQVDRGPSVGSYIVRIQNIGAHPLDGSFSDGGSRLETDDGKTYYSPGAEASSTIEPAATSDIVITFDVPPRTRPGLLILRLALGDVDVNSQWSPTG